MENGDILEVLTSSLFFLFIVPTVGLKKITTPCLMISYCSICESNEIFGRKEYKLLSELQRKKKACESNNYTFKLMICQQQSLLTENQEDVYLKSKLLKFPFYSPNRKCVGRGGGEVHFICPRTWERITQQSYVTTTVFSRLLSPPKLSFYLSNISDFPSFSLDCSGILAPLSLSGR